jgi:hypothetical protein
MRLSRIFNGVERIDVEWTILGQRYRLPSMTLMVGALLAGVAIAVVSSAWLGAAVAAPAAAAVVYGNWRLNQMDQAGALGEITQLALLWRTSRRPYITNTTRN